MTGSSAKALSVLFVTAWLAGCGGAPPAAEPAPVPPVAQEPEEAVQPPARPDPTEDTPESPPAAAETPVEGVPRPPQIALAQPADDDRAGEATTLDGVYTDAQARRGFNVYRQICSDCHEPADWQDDAFLARWNGESVYRFWYYIFEQMPEGEPPYTLSREQVTDVVTYIFQLNALPEGQAELGADEDSIDDHWLYWGGAGVGR
ncbi:MAG: cytochrome c [Gemmatimonadetes bacterium]|nr:cytochrome c [Gemmatimonadota bacterium]